MGFWIDIWRRLDKDKINNSQLSLNLKDCFDSKQGEKVSFNNNLYDIVKKIEINKSTIEITKRFIDNGDVFLFFEINNPNDFQIQIDFNKKIIANDFEEIYQKPKFDNRYGENKVTGPSYYIDTQKESAVISKIYYYRELYAEYKKTENSILYDLKLEDNTIQIEDDKLNINISSKGEICSFFLLLSQQKLFKEKLNRESYFQFYFKNVENNFVANSFFVQKSGTYTKLPYSIEPFTKDGYGYSLHHSSKKELISFLQTTQERYFYNMIINAIMQAFLYQKQENGVFYTPYTSTWLKKDTGITAPYIDTRLNETFNLMIKDFIQLAPKSGVQDNTKNYMDFILNYEDNGGDIYQAGEGKFFPDYFKYNLKNKTHASLNHQLGIANGMFKMYEQTNDRRYLQVFNDIIKFIENTRRNWIRENKDLYYGIKIEKNNFIYYGNDYIYVTLIDLLITQKNILSLTDVINECIEELILSKVSYLEEQGYSIFDENAKFASGEPIESRSQALKLYNEIKFRRKE